MGPFRKTLHSSTNNNSLVDFSARHVLFSKMWRIVLVFSQVSLCMSAPQACKNHAGESVPCANLLLNKFGLPVFDMTRVLHRERPCFNNDGDRVACYQPGNGESGLRAHVSDEGWCKADADCYSGNCCQNYCKPQSWNCVGGIHQGPTTKAPHHVQNQGQSCMDSSQCSQHPYPLLCHKPYPDQMGTCRECSDWKASEKCPTGYKCTGVDFEGEQGICLPEKCSDTKKCHHGLRCCKRLSGTNECLDPNAICNPIFG